MIPSMCPLCGIPHAPDKPATGFCAIVRLRAEITVLGRQMRDTLGLTRLMRHMGLRPALTHTVACQTAHGVAQAWWRMWPLACTRCGGAGEMTWYEDVVGDGGPRMQMGETCAYCVDALICPRCAMPMPDFEDTPPPCTSCGWAGADDGAPYDPHTEPYCCWSAYPEIAA